MCQLYSIFNEAVLFLVNYYSVQSSDLENTYYATLGLHRYTCPITLLTYCVAVVFWSKPFSHFCSTFTFDNSISIVC